MHEANFNEHIRPDLKKLETLPDFSNEFTRDVFEKLGEFIYDSEDSEAETENLPYFGPVEMEN